MMRTDAIMSRRRPRSSTSRAQAFIKLPSLALVVLLLSRPEVTSSFGLPLTKHTVGHPAVPTTKPLSSRDLPSIPRNSPTALNVWFFGGDQNEPQGDDDSCELVAVRIERPTSNSRKIAGELSVPGVTVEDVWSILTDYNRLSIHVPNLKESKIVQENNNSFMGGAKSHPGDGSYKCQLYQVGAQKIVGFDFSASVTMDMTEQILTASTSNARKILFKCVSSQFFTTFDGAWTIQEQQNAVTGETEVLCSYDVLVKPKGPVPVAALEWRIREDVPTNLRAVKAATLNKVSSSSLATTSPATGTTSPKPVKLPTRRAPQLAAVMVDWERGETMAKYMD